ARSLGTTYAQVTSPPPLPAGAPSARSRGRREGNPKGIAISSWARLPRRSSSVTGTVNAGGLRNERVQTSLQCRHRLGLSVLFATGGMRSVPPDSSTRQFRVHSPGQPAGQGKL